MKRKHKIEVGVKHCDTCEQNIIRCNECFYKSYNELLLKIINELGAKNVCEDGTLIYNDTKILVEQVTISSGGSISIGGHIL